MKYRYFLSLAASLVAFQSSFAHQDQEWSNNVSKHGDKPAVYYGPTTLSDQTLENLTVYGPATLSGFTVNHLTTIKGPAEASHSSFYDFHIDGIVTFDDVKVLNQLFINGPVVAKNSVIEEISVASNELTLSNTQVKKIFVRKNNYMPDKQRIFLEKGSKIDSIIFESNKGLVIASGSSTVEHLEGGKLEQKNE